MSTSPSTLVNVVGLESPRAASGFTAANRSPSSSSEQALDAPIVQSDAHKSDSDSVPTAKRKYNDTHPRSGDLQKRPRMSPSKNGDGPTRVFDQDKGHANGAAWPEHQRNESTTSDAALAEVLTNDMSHVNGGTSSAPDVYQQHNMQNEFPANVDGKYQLTPGSTPQQLQRGAGQRKRYGLLGCGVMETGC